MVQIKNLSQSETLLVDPFEEPYRLFYSGQPYCIVKHVIIVLIVESEWAELGELPLKQLGVPEESATDWFSQPFSIDTRP